MRTLEDLIFSPWQLLQTLFGEAVVVYDNPLPPPPPAPDASAADQVPPPPPSEVESVSQALCETQKVGEQLLDICRVGGYEMPDFIFFASLGILSFFVFCLIRLLKQTTETGARVYRVYEAVRKLPDPKAETSSVSELLKVRQSFQKDKLMKRLWERFEKALVPEATGKKSASLKDDTLVLTTQAPEGVFSQRSIVEEQIQTSFFSSVPSILTAFGLLMTFIAILDGLSYVSVTDTLEVKGIGGLINGLSGKFFSSVVALSCSVSFVLVEKLTLGQLISVLVRLQHELNRRFALKSYSQIMHDLHDHLAGQDGLRHQLTEKILELRGKKV